MDRESFQRGLLAGESGSVERFLRELEPLAIGIARKQYRFSVEESEDILVAVFEKLWRDDKKALRAWRGQVPLRAYLGVVVNRFCLMQVRRRSRESREIGTEALDSFPAAPETDGAEQAEVRQVFRSALTRLTDRDRKLIEMRYLEEQDYPHIVAETGSTYGAVRKAVHTALKRLRGEMARISPELFQGPETGR